MSNRADEVRLLATLATNGLMLAAAWRIAGRWSRRPTVAVADTLLIWLAAQYIVVGGLGLVGLLRAETMLGVAALGSLAVLLFVTARPKAQTHIVRDHLPIAGLGFVLMYALSFCFAQRLIPQLATDPLIYHLPAAARWIQEQRIGLVDFAYWLPANTYSPLGGSVWIAWWLAPIGNDALARFVQLPAWLLLYAAILRLLAMLNVRPALATPVAIAAVVSHPFILQLPMAKDDIAVAALIVLSIVGLRDLRRPGGTLRLGLSLGLLFSIKYTVVLSLPILLLAVPWRRLPWRRLTIALLVAGLLAGPWYVRNALWTGNPFYPIGSAGLTVVPSDATRTPIGLWHTLVTANHGLTWPLLAICVPFAIAATIPRLRRPGRQPLSRAVLLGPWVSVAGFVCLSPFAEARFVFPAMALLLATPAIVLAGVRRRSIATSCAWLILGVSVATSFEPAWLVRMAVFASVAFAAGMATLALLALGATPIWRKRLVVIGTGGALVLTIGTYVGWQAYLRHPDAGYAVSTDIAWRLHYPGAGEMWWLLRTHLPPGSTVACINTPTTWPLFGFDLTNRVVYAPVREGVNHLHDLPPSAERVPAREAYRAATRQLTADARQDVWLANLDRLRVDYLFIARHDADDTPPEIGFIRGSPGRFRVLAENDAAMVVQVVRMPAQRSSNRSATRLGAVVIRRATAS